MKRILGIVMGGALVLGLGISSPAMAQRNGMGFFHAPVFVAQPGLVHSLSRGATTEFNARVVTAIPGPRSTALFAHSEYDLCW